MRGQTVVAFFLLALLLCSFVFADGPGGDDRPSGGDKEGGKEGGEGSSFLSNGCRRNIQMNTNQRKVQFNSKLQCRSGAAKNATRASYALDMAFNIEGMPDWKLRYTNASSTQFTSSEFRVFLAGLAEYQNLDGVSGFQPNGTDKLLDDLRELRDKNQGLMDTLTCSSTTQTSNNDTVKVYTCKASGTNSPITITLRAADNITTLSDGVVLNPNTFKFDIEVNYPTYKYDNATGVAILFVVVSKVMSKSRTDGGFVGDDSNVAGDNLPYFGWVNQVKNRGGQTFPIYSKSTTMDPSSEGRPFQIEKAKAATAVWFSVDNKQTYFLWDPEVGVTSLSQASNAVTLFTSSSLLLALLASIMVLFL